MIPHELSILYEDNHLLVVEKPSGLATIGVIESEVSLAKLAKEYIRRKHRKPGNVYLGVMSRLDALVSGVIVFARTSKSAARLSEQFRAGKVAKRYWAIVAGAVDPTEGSLEHWLQKDERSQRIRAVQRPATGAKKESAQKAKLSYRVLGRDRQESLLEIELATGRKHQIRVQLSAQGWPILGDKKYGSKQGFAQGIALHSVGLGLIHPTKDVAMTFRSPPPARWKVARFRVDFDKQSLNLE